MQVSIEQSLTFLSSAVLLQGTLVNWNFIVDEDDVISETIPESVNAEEERDVETDVDELSELGNLGDGDPMFSFVSVFEARKPCSNSHN